MFLLTQSDLTEWHLLAIREILSATFESQKSNKTLQLILSGSDFTIEDVFSPNEGPLWCLVVIWYSLYQAASSHISEKKVS
jgi:hypothetical protein